MPRMVRLMLGAITVALFTLVGATFVSEGSAVLGGVLIALAVLRAIHLVQQAKPTPSTMQGRDPDDNA